ncbi:capsular polysaccharide export protein, LipB/KpsS family [Microbulbifer sp. PSTR4-B]|uniref:capsular polysaccharide export protein, LipB/KpsS family n=1 Tax=Microbulbifer sp. PSTR4-B TaxID=3243396 RepID=UPI004039E3FB
MYFNEIEIHRYSPAKKKVAVIFTFRHSEARPNDLLRIANILTKINRTADISTYLVDSGSPENISLQLRDICKQHTANYIKVRTDREIFSIGKARNIGASHALEDHIFFHDIDLIATDQFYLSLVKDVSTNWQTNKFNCYPCFYITQDSTESYDWSMDENINSVLEDYYLGHDGKIQNPALASSCLLIERTYFLSVGGVDFDFHGHGFEDFELMNRLCYNYPIFERPRDYYRDTKKWFTGRYEGFRALFSMHGRLQLSRGLYLIHLWHPNDSDSNYVKSTKRNANLLTKKLKEFDQKATHPTPLPDLNAGKTCALGNPNNLFYKSIRDAIPHFGELHFIEEKDINNLDEFHSWLIRKSIDRVLLPNPYGNENRLKIYQKLKNEQFPIIVSDRGALNNSYFFDENGFNFDSESYHPEFWDKPVPSSEREELESYIATEVASDTALEHQGQRQSPESIKRQLGIHSRKKILFVPFQRPVDTVCKYFCGPIKSYSGFLELVEELADTLDNDWVIVGKKHPLEDHYPELSRITWAQSDMHFKDLINISDAVLVINSGVGVQSLMWNKKVVVAGDAFYGHRGLTFQSANASEIEKILNDDSRYPDPEKIKRFIYFLLKKMYSFGEASVKITKLENGHNHSATTEIAFKEIRLPNRQLTLNRNYSIIKRNSGVFRDFTLYFESRHPGQKKAQFNNPQFRGVFTRFKKRIAAPGFTRRNIKKLFSQPSTLITDTKNIISGY